MRAEEEKGWVWFPSVALEECHETHGRMPCDSTFKAGLAVTALIKYLPNNSLLSNQLESIIRPCQSRKCIATVK